jgi:hypothetical protein
MANLSNINNKFIVTDGGNVLIGNTANSSGRLQIKDTQTSNFNDGLAITRNNAAQTGYINMVGGAFNFNSPGLSYKFRNNGTQTLELNSSGNATFTGNVGIGAAASDGNLHVRKTGINTGITNVLMNANFADGSNGTGLSIGYRTDETTAVLAARTATGNIAFYSYDGGWSESMRIKNDGNVGIGTDSPNYQLEVRTTTNNRAIQAVNSTTSGTNWGFQGGAYGSGATKNIGLQVTAEGASTNYAAIFENGNVGIGTTGPTAKLVVDSGSFAVQGISTPPTSGFGLEFWNNSATSYMGSYNRTTAVYRDLFFFANETIFQNAGTERMRITSAGNVGIGETSPSDKLQIGQGHSVLVGDYFQLGSGSASIMGALGWNRDTTSGVIYNTNFGAFQMHNNEGKLCLQGYNASGVNQFQHEFYNNGNVYFVGNVGIGLTNPTVKLHVVDTTTLVGAFVSNNSTRTELAIDNTSTNSVRLGLKATPSGAIIDSTNHSGSSGQPLIFQLNASEKMRISSVGRVTINTTVVADAMCTIAGNSSNYALNLYADVVYAGGYRYQRFRSGSNIAGGIESSNQTSVTYNTSSDYRMKKNIKPLEDGLDRVCKLKPVKFDWKLNDESTEGFIAHEVQEIFPDAISGEKDGEDMQGMDYGRITPLLVAAIQELKADNDSLKARIETLENN